MKTGETRKQRKCVEGESEESYKEEEKERRDEIKSLLPFCTLGIAHCHPYMKLFIYPHVAVAFNV